MKKVTVFVVLMALTFSMYGQIIGIDFAAAKKVYSDDEIEYEKLLKLENSYVIPFNQTPVGLKHCIERLTEILFDNDQTIDDAVRKDIFLAEYVDGLTDYSSLCTSAKVGSSEVSIAWAINEYRMSLVISEDAFGIFFYK